MCFIFSNFRFSWWLIKINQNVRKSVFNISQKYHLLISISVYVLCNNFIRHFTTYLQWIQPISSWCPMHPFSSSVWYDWGTPLRPAWHEYSLHCSFNFEWVCKTQQVAARRNQLVKQMQFSRWLDSTVTHLSLESEGLLAPRHLWQSKFSPAIRRPYPLQHLQRQPSE